MIRAVGLFLNGSVVLGKGAFWISVRRQTSPVLVLALVPEKQFLQFRLCFLFLETRFQPFRFRFWFRSECFLKKNDDMSEACEDCLARICQSMLV